MKTFLSQVAQRQKDNDFKRDVLMDFTRIKHEYSNSTLSLLFLFPFTYSFSYQ